MRPEIAVLDGQLNVAIGTISGTVGVPEPGMATLVTVSVLIIAGRTQIRRLARTGAQYLDYESTSLIV
jgi:hypothetical protein